MAKRPVFIAKGEYPFYEIEDAQFEFHPGFSLSQKQKSVSELHRSFECMHPKTRVLEISTKSASDLGVRLSAFNLPISVNGKDTFIECAFQGSKRFVNGGPYIDIYMNTPWEAKKDIRLRESGELISFVFGDEEFCNDPKDFFYNWIYIKALSEQADLVKKIADYDGFTDIEFNPQKSLNCQAKAIAIAVGLIRAGVFAEAITDKDSFLNNVYGQNKVDRYEQMTLFDVAY